MKYEDLRNIIEAETTQAGGNKRIAYRNVANKIDGLLESKKIEPSDIPLRELYRATVDPNLQLLEASASDIAEAVNSSAFPNITTKVMHRTMIPAYELSSSMVDQLVSEEDAIIAGTNPIPGLIAADSPSRRRESHPYKETGMSEKYCEIDTSDFGEIISITRETIFNDRTGNVVNKAREIGTYLGQIKERMIIQTIEVAARTDMEESTSRAFVLGGTAITAANFYNSDHSAIAGLDGQVNNNTDDTDVDDITPDGVDTLKGLFPKMKDEKGRNIVIRPRVMLVPEKLERKAWQLLNSDKDFDSANNAKNYFKGLYTLVSSPFLSTDYYYYIGEFAKQLVWLWVWKPETEVQNANSNLAFERQVVLRIRCSMNGGVGHRDYRYIARGGKTA